MKPLAERADSVDETIEQLRKAVKVIPLLQVFFQNRPAIRIGGFHGSGNYEYVLQGDNFEALGKAASTLQKAMEGVAGLRDIKDRKSTRLNTVTNAHLVCRLLLEKKTKTTIRYQQSCTTLNKHQKTTKH